MVNISKFGDSAIKFKFTDNDHYLFNGEIEVPINSLLLVLDESDMVTFKKIDGDPFVSFLISNSNFESKETLIYFYKTSMVGSTGGGSESGITSGDVQTMINTSLEDYYDIDEIDAALSGKADTSAVTEAINSAVSGKADTSAVTESINAAVSGKADTSAVTEAITAAVSGKADTSAITTSITSASTDTQVPSAKAVYDSNPWFILQNPNNSQRGVVSKLAEYYDTNIGQQSYIFGSGNPWSGQLIMARGQYSYAFGLQTSAMTQGAVAEGRETLASALFSHSEGEGVKATNIAEHSQGRYNVSNQASSGTFGNSGNTLFSVGNGTSDSARHNAFEIRQNGDIYLTKDGQDVKLQDQLGGGVTVDPSLDSGSTNPVANSAITTAINAKQDTLVSGTNIKTINNESILGEGNITIEGGGMDDNTQQLIATSLVDLNDRKADKSLLGNYQKKGDYATKSELATKANISDVMTLEKSTNNELVTASALNNLNNRFGGLSLVKMTESVYSALTTKDENTLYIVIADPS